MTKWATILDYRHIISQHWNLFQKLFGYGKGNSSKEKRTAWINEVNEIRRIVAHGSSGRSITFEQLANLEEYETWLNNQIKLKIEDTDMPSEEVI